MTNPEDTIPYGFCQCGCGERTQIINDNNVGLGRRKGEQSKFVRGHQRRSKNPEYIIDELTGCWNWQRAMMTNGYGKGCIGSKVMEAHRIAYIRSKGEISPG